MQKNWKQKAVAVVLASGMLLLPLSVYAESGASPVEQVKEAEGSTKEAEEESYEDVLEPASSDEEWYLDSPALEELQTGTGRTLDPNVLMPVVPENEKVYSGSEKPAGETQLVVEKEGKEKTVYKISLKGYTGSGGSLYAAVWSGTNGQDDLKWIQMMEESGNYTAEIELSALKDIGTVYAYAYEFSPEPRFIQARAFSASYSSADTLDIEQTDGDTLRATVSGVSSLNGVKEVSFAVWTEESDQDDLKWYQGRKTSNGTYEADIPFSDHSREAGRYIVHCYVRDSDGSQSCVAKGSAVCTPDAEVAVQAQEEVVGYRVIVSVTGNPFSAGYTAAIWSENNGQDDLKWISLSRLANGTFSTLLDPSDYTDRSGLFHIHIYQTGTTTFVGATSVDVPAGKYDPVSADSLKVTEETSEKLVVSVHVSGSPDKVQIPVWNKADQSDIVWYDAVGQGNGIYEAEVLLSRHSYANGIYNIHVYATRDGTQSGLLTFMTYTVSKAETTTSAVISGAGITYEKGDLMPYSYSIPTDGLPIICFGQQDGAWGSRSYWGETYASAACGPTAYAMLVSYYKNKVITPADIISELSLSYTDYTVGFKVADHYGIGLTYGSNGDQFSAYSSGMDPASSRALQLKAWIRSGHPVVCSVWGRAYGKFNHSNISHLILVRGMTSDGQVLINDPACGSPYCSANGNNGMTWEEFARVLKYYFVYDVK